MILLVILLLVWLFLIILLPTGPCLVDFIIVKNIIAIIIIICNFTIRRNITNTTTNNTSRGLLAYAITICNLTNNMTTSIIRESPVVTIIDTICKITNKNSTIIRGCPYIYTIFTKITIIIGVGPHYLNYFLQD